MKERLRLWYDRLFTPARPLEAGVFQYQTPPDTPTQYRLHLRIEPGGNGVLIVNASTVLHLNQTAAEYAYHLIRHEPEDQVAKWISQRYQVSEQQARRDYHDLKERIESLIDTPDLDPITFLDFERLAPYSVDVSAPYRLDCALTYQVLEKFPEGLTPTDRVKRELLTEEWKQVIDKAWHAGIPHIIFTGGEATLRPDLPELIAYAESLGQVTGLLTAGCRLSDTNYLHTILQSGLDHVMLVLDPTDEQCWESLRDLLVEDIHVTIHLTITPDNKVEFAHMVGKLKDRGVTAVSLSISEESLKDFLSEARESVAAKDINLIWDIPVPYSASHPVAYELENEEEVLAGAGKAWLYVEPDGDVLPTQGANQVLGNMLADSWETIWDQAKSLN